VRERYELHVGDVRERLDAMDAGSVHCCVTSPPYWGLRDYGVDGQIGLESTPDEFVSVMVDVFRRVRRVLRDDGTLWLNLGDSYAQSEIRNRNGESAAFHRPCRDGVAQTGKKVQHSLKPKDLCMMPWRVALALQADGWWLRSVICWAKKSPMPESVRDRPTSAWEPIFLMAKSERYYYDAEAVRQPDKGADHQRNVLDAPNRANGFFPADGGIRTGHGRNGTGANLRNVWHLGPEPYAEAHFATFPSEIPRRAILAGTSERGCCPACGAPWVRIVERRFDAERAEAIRSLRTLKHCDQTKDAEQRKLNGNDLATLLQKRTAGWMPGCECGHETVDLSEVRPHAPVPCAVLDPFLGSGTTIATALALGRRGVGIELNPAYVELARERISKTSKPHTHMSGKLVDAPLFEGCGVIEPGLN